MLGALLLVSGRPPDSIFLVALLTDRSPLGPQGCGLLTQEPLLSLPSRNDIRGGWFRWRRFWRLGAYRHKGLHGSAVSARTRSTTSRPDEPLTAGRFASLVVRTAGTKQRSTFSVWPGSSAVRVREVKPLFSPLSLGWARERRRGGCV